MSQGDVFNIPQFVEARTEQDLVRAMLLNNIKHGIEFRYFDINQKKKGGWIAWFYSPADRKAFIVEELGKSGDARS